MMDGPQLIRIFLSSPGDVTDERALVLTAIDRLAYDPLLRGKVIFDVVAWDKPGSDAPMLATMTPQEAINQGLPMPSKCDIVIVIFWSRMGTPLPYPDYQKADGTAYESGTEWEYEDARQAALKSGKPYVVVYRRTEEPVIGLRDPQRSEKISQWERVEAFFEQFTDDETGAIRGGINRYEQPDGFREKVETHLKSLIQRLLEEPDKSVSSETDTETPLWVGSPFPGLRAFTPEDAPIFFGRGSETDVLIKRLSDPQTRFVMVIGASGSGKSSLVGAGLLPRLVDNAIEGSRDWLWVRFTPGAMRSGDPFEAFSEALRGKFPLRDRLVQDLPDQFEQVVTALVAEQKPWTELVLFIDQFEELFSLVQPRFVEPFIDFLVDVVQMPNVRVVATLRADFLPASIDCPQLARLLNRGTYNLPLPEPGALYEMITRPADRAGLQFEEGLAGRILSDTGRDPGALALMAYTLDELYRISQDDQTLDFADYAVLGGVQGAIGERAEHVFRGQAAIDQAALPTIFQELVEVDERGVAVRRRATLRQAARDDSALRLMTALTEARLLVQNQGEGDEPIVEVAHEALLRSWKRLADWIQSRKDDLRLRSQIEQAVNEWQSRDCDPAYLLSGGRLADARAWQTRFPAGEVARNFIIASTQQEQEQQALEAERAAREQLLKQRAANRLHYMVGILAVSLVVAIILMVFAFSQSNQAEEAQYKLETQVVIAQNEQQRAEDIAAIANQRSAEVQSVLWANAAQLVWDNGNDPTFVALPLALEANKLTENPPPLAQNILSQIAYAPGPRYVFGPSSDTALSSDGRLVAAGRADQVVIWDVATGAVVRELNRETAMLDHIFPTGWFLGAAVAFSPDGRWLLSSGCNEYLRGSCLGITTVLWDIDSGKPIHAFLDIYSEHDSSNEYDSNITLYTTDVALDLQNVGFLGNGKTAFIDSGQQVFLFDVDPDSATFGDLLETILETINDPDIYGYTNSVFTRDGRHVLTLLSSLDAWKTLWADDDSRYGIARVALSHDEKLAVTTFTNGWLLLWDIDEDSRTFGEYQKAEIDIGYVNHFPIAFSPDDRMILTASEDDLLRLWNINGSELSWPRTGSMPLGVSDITFMPDGQNALLTTYNDPGQVMIWDLYARNKLSYSLSSLACSPMAKNTYVQTSDSPHCSPDGKTALFIEGDSLVLWNADSASDAFGQILHTFSAIKELIMWSIVAPDGKQALTLTSSGSIWFDETLTLWDIDQDSDTFGHILRQSRRIEEGIPSWFMYTLDGNLIAVTGNNVTVWDVDRDSDTFGQPIHQYTGSISLYDYRYVPYVMPDNQSILSMTEDGELIHLNTNPESPDIGQIMQTFAGDSDDYVDGFNVSPDQTIVVTSHLDRSTHNLRRTIVWDIETGAMLHSFTGDSAVSRVTFMPDSKSIWGLSNNNDLIQLDINPESPTIGQVMRTFAGHSDTITSFSISPDATEVLTGSMDTTLILRDIETGAMIRQFVGHTKPVAAVAFTPDGSRVVSGTYGEVVNSFLGSTESTVIVWDIASGEPLRVFEGIAGDIHQLAVSEDGKFIIVNRTGPALRNDSVQDLIDWAQINRYVRDLTCGERRQYRLNLPPKCK